MRVIKTVMTKHPKSFDNIHLCVSAVRDVFQVRANGGEPDINIVTSEVITVDEFRADIADEFGPLNQFEHYIDNEDAKEVVRGIVLHNGIRKVFIHRFDELTKQALEDTKMALRLTIKWSEGQ